MFENLGVVTNVWSICMESGTRFEELAYQFANEGFTHFEVREGRYLRNSGCWSFAQEIETVMEEYTDGEWREICAEVWAGRDLSGLSDQRRHSIFCRIGAFVQETRNFTLSYAMSHPWLSVQTDVKVDEERIIRAKKLAYMLCPHQARLRLVDLQYRGRINKGIAIGNVKRYSSLLPEYPVVFAVENAYQSAISTLQVAMEGSVCLTYDEANTYQTDGTVLNSSKAFWDSVSLKALTSVHLKQKTSHGVLSRVDNGFVDFAMISHHLREGGYMGDLLLENSPTDQPLIDAIRSREFLLATEI